MKHFSTVSDTHTALFPARRAASPRALRRYRDDAAHGYYPSPLLRLAIPGVIVASVRAMQLAARLFPLVHARSLRRRQPHSLLSAPRSVTSVAAVTLGPHSRAPISSRVVVPGPQPGIGRLARHLRLKEGTHTRSAPLTASSVTHGSRLTPHCSGLIVSRSRSFLFAAELDIVRRLNGHEQNTFICVSDVAFVLVGYYVHCASGLNLLPARFLCLHPGAFFKNGSLAHPRSLPFRFVPSPLPSSRVQGRRGSGGFRRSRGRSRLPARSYSFAPACPGLCNSGGRV